MPLPLEQLKDQFGTYSIPQQLQDLLRFQNASDSWYSDSFELAAISKDGLKTYFGDNEESLSQFIEFGHDGNGSTYAFWLYKEKGPENAPIVYFNAEGIGNTVVANNFIEFLTILAGDRELIFGSYPESDDDIEHTERNQEFRTWLEQHFQLHVAFMPNDVIQQAQRNHPDLEEWITHVLESKEQDG